MFERCTFAANNDVFEEKSFGFPVRSKTSLLPKQACGVDTVGVGLVSGSSSPRCIFGFAFWDEPFGHHRLQFVQSGSNTSDLGIGVDVESCAVGVAIDGKRCIVNQLIQL